MGRMGNHSKPVNGIPVTNGHAPASALMPFAIPELQVRQGGAMSPWPQPAKPDHWQAAMTAVRRVVAHRGWLAAIPVVLVNAVAVIAQLAFLRGHLSWAPAGQVLVAVTLESVAVYLAWQAHLAIIADDSAMRLRLAAYGFAAIVGAANYSHYMAPGWRPTFPALAFALCSVVSPWLWSIHSRRQSRDALKARGLIEPHAVRLGATRWMWHPWRSARVMWHATWLGENDPAKAIALAEPVVSAVAQDDDTEHDTDDDSDTTPPPPDDDTDDDTDPPLDDDKKDDTSPPPPPPPDPPKDRRKPPTGRDKALTIMKRHPGLPDAEVAKKAGVSVRTVQRAREAPKGQDAEETS